MAKKKLIEIKKNEPIVPLSSREAKEKLAATIELFKIQNPEKYEKNKAALEKQLEQLE